MLAFLYRFLTASWGLRALNGYLLVKEVRKMRCVSNDVIFVHCHEMWFWLLFTQYKRGMKKKTSQPYNIHTHTFTQTHTYSFLSLSFEPLSLSSIVCGIEKLFKINASEKRARDAAIRAKLFKHRREKKKPTSYTHMIKIWIEWTLFGRTILLNRVEITQWRCPTSQIESVSYNQIDVRFFCAQRTSSMLKHEKSDYHFSLLTTTTTMAMNERVCVPMVVASIH